MPWAYGVFAAMGLLYGVVLARRFKAPEAVEGQRVSVPAAAAVAAAILTLYIIMGKRERVRENAMGHLLWAGDSNAW
jgi:hypothetical protein